MTMEWMNRKTDVTPITIGNDGPEIGSTNYWDTSAARAGLCYLSGNAGALRLLVPQALADRCLPEMRTGKRVAIEVSMHSPQCVDVVFEDGTQTPFCIALDRRQVDRLGGAAKNVPFTVWTPQGKVLTFKATVETSRRTPS
jgi:hypothetical protein